MDVTLSVALFTIAAAFIVGGLATMVSRSSRIGVAQIAFGVSLALLWWFYPKSVPFAVVASLVFALLAYWFQAQIEATFPNGPQVILDGQDAFFVKRVAWFFGSTQVLGVRLRNAPRDKTERGVAKGLGGVFTCVGTGLQLPWIDARLDHSPQPGPGVIPELVFDLSINKWKELNLIIKEDGVDSCYLFNNDSYNYIHKRMQNPAWEIGPGQYMILVKITGVDVDEQFECIFVNPGRGASLEVKSFKRSTNPAHSKAS